MLRKDVESMPDEKARAKNKTARVTPGGYKGHSRLILFAITKKMQQEYEHVDEVKIER